MGSPLKGVSRVRWGELRDADGAPAAGIPALLSRIAYGDDETAVLALDELGDRVCSLGFVVGEATAATVPFLLELAGAPTPFVPCKAELLELLENIVRTEQWHSCAAAAGGPRRVNYQEQPGWEVASRAAVLAGRPVAEALALSVRPEEAVAARSLLRAMDGIRPFPEV
jgi:hypothetical protein